MSFTIKSSTRVHEIVELFKAAFPNSPEIVLFTQKKNQAGADRRIVALTEKEIVGLEFIVPSDYIEAINEFRSLTGVEICLIENATSVSDIHDQVGKTETHLEKNTDDSETGVENKQLQDEKLKIEEGKRKIVDVLIKLKEEKSKLDVEKKAIEEEKRQKEIEQKLKIEKIFSLYSEEKYLEVICEFESNKEWETNENIVDKYLWSLYMNSGTEDKVYLLIYEYKSVFNNTTRWDILLGHYFKWKKYYHLALNQYKDCSENNYNEVKKIFDDYDVLYQGKKYREVRSYFEEKLYASHSKDDFDVVNKYLWALYKNSGTEEKALEKTKQFMAKYNYKPWNSLLGHLYSFIGVKKSDIPMLKEAIDHYSINADLYKSEIQEVKDKIEKIELKNDISFTTSELDDIINNNALETEMLSQEVSKLSEIENTDKALKEIEDLDVTESHNKIIRIFEKNKGLKQNLTAVNRYLQAKCCKSGESETELEDLIKEIIQYQRVFPNKLNSIRAITLMLLSDLKKDVSLVKDALSCAKKTSNTELIAELEDKLKDFNRKPNVKSSTAYRIFYSIKLKDDAGFLNSFSNKMNAISSGKGFFGAMSQSDKKGGYRQREIDVEHNGDLSESAAKKYVIANDRDVKEGLAGSSTIIIEKIKKI